LSTSLSSRHLDQNSILDGLLEKLGISLHPRSGNILKCRQFFGRDVLPLVFSKSIKKNRALVSPECHQPSKRAPLTLPRSSQPLLDHTPTQVGIDQPTVSPLDRFPQGSVCKALPACEFQKIFRLENLHAAPSESQYLIL